jgi:hypothetical protein
MLITEATQKAMLMTEATQTQVRQTQKRNSTPYTRLPDVHFSSPTACLILLLILLILLLEKLPQGRLRRARHLLHLCKIL